MGAYSPGPARHHARCLYMSAYTCSLHGRMHVLFTWAHEHTMIHTVFHGLLAEMEEDRHHPPVHKEAYGRGYPFF